MIVFAPAALANIIAVIETPPVPIARTVCPGLSGKLPYNAFQAVVPVHTKLARCPHDNVVVLGILTMAVARMATYSRSTPSIGPPRPCSQSACGP